MESTQDRLIRYLNDAWAVEKALVTALKDMADETDDPKVATLFAEHRAVTHQQEEELEARIRALGSEPSSAKGLMNTLMAKAGDALQSGHDEYDKTTLNVMKAYGTEHFEIAMYQSLEAYARAIGDAETASLARRIMQQEREAAEKIWPLIAPAASRAVAPALDREAA